MEDVYEIIAQYRKDDPLWLEIQLAILFGKIDKKEALKRARGVMKTFRSWQELEAEMYDELVP
ncbi:hypothetical protein A3K92_02975 [Thermococcus gorgonarius]|uniref:Uncharacterized protein n=2 Tax=Thermococcus gorgonarius TaxID=71997 RepID=A0A2Z2MDE8_THEGO|nr:hypothetical protein A3K92_02975 [Thermococcus gorgonarius]